MIFSLAVSACFGDIALDEEPPGAVSSFAAVGGNGEVALSWVNPTDDDFAGVMIRRATDTYPSAATDGDLAFEGTATTVTDSALTNGSTYLYTAFAFDQTQNFSQGIQASATTTAIDTTAPGDVTGIFATPGNGEVTLSWVNPADSDPSRARRIVRHAMVR